MSQKAISAQGLARWNWLLFDSQLSKQNFCVGSSQNPPSLAYFSEERGAERLAEQTTGTPLRAAHTPRPGSITLSASTGPATYYYERDQILLSKMTLETED